MSTQQEFDWQRAYSNMLHWRWEGLPSHESVLSAVGFMENALGLKKGDKVLDLGCGLGLHAIELVRRGYDTTGLDYSKAYLEVARQNAAQAGITVRFIEGDMACLTFEKQFDAVIQWGNSFGMLSHEDNLRTLRGMKRALKPGGLALIDSQNYYSLQEKLSQGWSFDREDPTLLFLTEGTREIVSGRFGFTVTAINITTGERHVMPHSWRLYLTPELEHLLPECGLELLGVYGDDPAKVDWKNFKRGEPSPYAVDGYTDNAAKRILLCRAM